MPKPVPFKPARKTRVYHGLKRTWGNHPNSGHTVNSKRHADSERGRERKEVVALDNFSETNGIPFEVIKKEIVMGMGIPFT